MNRHTIKKKVQPRLEQAIASPYVGWVLMNVLVWSLGLYVIALCIRFLGVAGAPVGAILIGGIVGAGQAWILRRMFPITPRQWTGASLIGTVVGILPVALLFLWILLIAVIGLNSVLLIIGALFGGILGGIQARVLHPIVYEKAAWWVIANLFAGALCAPLSLTGTTLWLPVICSLGPVVFGLVTAWTLRYLAQTWEAELDE